MKASALIFSFRFWLAALVFSTVGWLLAAFPLPASRWTTSLRFWLPLLSGLWLVLALGAGLLLRSLWNGEKEKAFVCAQIPKPLVGWLTLALALAVWFFLPDRDGRQGALMLLCAGQGLTWWLDVNLQRLTRKLALTRRPFAGILCSLKQQMAISAASFAMLMSIIIHQRSSAPGFRGGLEVSLALGLSFLLGWIAGQEGARAPARLARRLRRLSEQRDFDRLDFDASLASELGRAETAFNRIVASLQQDFKRLKELTHNIQTTDRNRSRFLASFSHELRTPLNTIIGYADLFLSNLAGELTPQAREYLQIIMQEGEKLLKVINQLLYFSRLDSGRDPLLPVTTTPSNLLHHLRENIEPGLEVQIECHLPEDLSLRLDENKLLHALKVLFMVASYGQPAGKISITLERNAQNLRLHCLIKTTQRVNTYSPQGAFWLLGLALVNTVSTMHGGRSYFQSRDGELEIEVLLPEVFSQVATC